LTLGEDPGRPGSGPKLGHKGATGNAPFRRGVERRASSRTRAIGQRRGPFPGIPGGSGANRGNAAGAAHENMAQGREWTP